VGRFLYHAEEKLMETRELLDMDGKLVEETQRRKQAENVGKKCPV